jgi:hypothetical protein
MDVALWMLLYGFYGKLFFSLVLLFFKLFGRLWLVCGGAIIIEILKFRLELYH